MLTEKHVAQIVEAVVRCIARNVAPLNDRLSALEERDRRISALEERVMLLEAEKGKAS